MDVKTVHSGQPHRVLTLCFGMLRLKGRSVYLNWSINDSIICPNFNGNVKPTLSRIKYILI